MPHYHWVHPNEQLAYLSIPRHEAGKGVSPDLVRVCDYCWGLGGGTAYNKSSTDNSSGTPMQPPSSNLMPKRPHPRTTVSLLKRCTANLGLFERGGQDVVADSGNTGDADDSDDLSASSEDDGPGAGTETDGAGGRGGGVKGHARGLHAGGAMRTRFARAALIPRTPCTAPRVPTSLLLSVLCLALWHLLPVVLLGACLS